MKKLLLFISLTFLSLSNSLLPQSYSTPQTLFFNAYLDIILSGFKGSAEITLFLHTPAFFYTQGLAKKGLWADGQVYINSTLYLEYRNDSYTVPPSSLYLEPGLYKVRLVYFEEEADVGLLLFFSFNSTILIEPYGFILKIDFPITVHNVKLEKGFLSRMIFFLENPTKKKILSSTFEVVGECPNLYEGIEYILLWARVLPYVSTHVPLPHPCTVRLASLNTLEVPFDAFAPTLWNVTYPDGYSELVSMLPSLVLPGTVIRNVTPIAGIRELHDYITLDFDRGWKTFAEMCGVIVNNSFSLRLEKGRCNLTLMEFVVAGLSDQEGIRALEKEYVYILRSQKTIAAVSPRVVLASPLPVKVFFETANPFNISLLIPIAEKTIMLPGVLRVNRNLTISFSLFPASSKVVEEELLINVSIPHRFFIYDEKSLRLYVLGSEKSSFQILAPLLIKATVDNHSVLIGDGRPLVRVEREGDGVLSFTASSKDTTKWGFSAPPGSYVMTLAAKLSVLSKSGGLPVAAEVVVEESGREKARGKGALVSLFLEPGKTYTVHVSYGGVTLSRIVDLSDDAYIEVTFPLTAFFTSFSSLLTLTTALLIIATALTARYRKEDRRRFVKYK